MYCIKMSKSIFLHIDEIWVDVKLKFNFFICGFVISKTIHAIS